MSNAKLSAFEERIENIKQRRGVLLFADASTYITQREEITAVDDGTNTVDVAADLSGLSVGVGVPIIDAPTDPNTGTYTLTDATYDGTTYTTLTFDEALGGATVEGYVVDPRFALNTAGIVKDTNIGGEPNQFGPDNQGRTFTKGFDITGQFAMMQTGAPELQNLPALAEPAGNGLYVAFVDNPFPVADQGAGVQFTDIALQDKVELLNAAVNPTFALDFSREESDISSEITGYVSVSELEKMYSAPILMG